MAYNFSVLNGACDNGWCSSPDGSERYRVCPLILSLKCHLLKDEISPSVSATRALPISTQSWTHLGIVQLLKVRANTRVVSFHTHPWVQLASFRKLRITPYRHPIPSSGWAARTITSKTCSSEPQCIKPSITSTWRASSQIPKSSYRPQLRRARRGGGSSS